MSNQEQFQYAVGSVKRSESMKGLTLTDDQIAEKLAIPRDKFQAYLQGSVPVPDGLPKHLLEAYGHRVVKVHHTMKKQFGRSEKDGDNPIE